MAAPNIKSSSKVRARQTRIKPMVNSISLNLFITYYYNKRILKVNPYSPLIRKNILIKEVR